MAKISKNATGIIVLVAALLGLDVPEQLIENAVAGVGACISLALLVWNQVARHDVTGFIFKK